MVKLVPKTLHNLLSDGESDVLDFKEHQYVIRNGKQEPEARRRGREAIVKDILAFSNAERPQTAHILVGVREKKDGKPAEVVGICESFRDEEFQNIFHGKTNIPVKFTYYELELKGQRLGVFDIPPAARRPICLRSDFEGIHAGQIWVRRGSTAEIAMPDEFPPAPKPRIATKPSDPELEDLAKRFIRIFTAHGAMKGDIPLLLPESAIPTSNLAHWQSTVDLLSEEVREETCRLFHVNRKWLDTGTGPIQRTIIFDSAMAEAIPEMARLRKLDTMASLNCISDGTGLDDLRISTGGMYLCAVIQRIGDREIKAYLPFDSTLPWRSPIHHTEYLILAIFTAMELDMEIRGTTRPLREISKIKDGEGFTSEFLKAHRAAGHWHPEDSTTYSNKYGIDLGRYAERDEYIRSLVAAKENACNGSTRWSKLLVRPTWNQVLSRILQKQEAPSSGVRAKQ